MSPRTLTPDDNKTKGGRSETVRRGPRWHMKCLFAAEHIGQQIARDGRAALTGTLRRRLQKGLDTDVHTSVVNCYQGKHAAECFQASFDNLSGKNQESCQVTNLKLFLSRGGNLPREKFCRRIWMVIMIFGFINVFLSVI